MRRTFHLINQNCRLASRLMSDAREHSLDRLERWGLRFHLIGCRSCRRYRHQLELLDQLMQRDTEHQSDKLSAQTRQRILKHIQGALKN
jgi:hypothetical protein